VKVIFTTRCEELFVDSCMTSKATLEAIKPLLMPFELCNQLCGMLECDGVFLMFDHEVGEEDVAVMLIIE